MVTSAIVVLEGGGAVVDVVETASATELDVVPETLGQRAQTPIAKPTTIRPATSRPYISVSNLREGPVAVKGHGPECENLQRDGLHYSQLLDRSIVRVKEKPWKKTQQKKSDTSFAP